MSAFCSKILYRQSVPTPTCYFFELENSVTSGKNETTGRGAVFFLPVMVVRIFFDIYQIHFF